MSTQAVSAVPEITRKDKIVAAAGLMLFVALSLIALDLIFDGRLSGMDRPPITPDGEVVPDA